MVGFGSTISEKVKGNKLIILEMNFFRKKREKTGSVYGNRSASVFTGFEWAEGDQREYSSLVDRIHARDGHILFSVA